MIIQEIIPVTAQKVRIVTDEQLAFVLYKGELSHYRLEAGQELTDEVFREIQNEILIKRAKLRAMHLLNRMDYTEAELENKLNQGEYTQEAVEQAIAYVRSFHYLDDSRYIEHYVNTHGARKSRRQIEFDLMRKGITREQIHSFYEMREDGIADETDVIVGQLERRWRNPQSADEKEIMKHYNYFVRKGFNVSDIKKAITKVIQKSSGIR